VVTEITAILASLLVAAAEWMHASRVETVAALAFGPGRRPAAWVRLSPALRVAGAGALVWGLTVLLLLEPVVHRAGVTPESEYRDLILMLDVSPSMRLQDAGIEGKLSRRQRAGALLKSFFERIPIELHRISVVAVYTGAKPVVVRTTDAEVVRNILEDLPMQYAFKAGPTDLMIGLDEVVKIARPFPPRRATLLIVSDGDTLPRMGLPPLPASIEHSLVVGVGDPRAGKFIDGHLSRQDTSALRQLAARLGGHYHDGNEKHIATDLVRTVTSMGSRTAVERLSRREYAILVCFLGSMVLAVLPLFLQLVGTRWSPGVRVTQRDAGPGGNR
jgi:Ca-activated chloride channel family protein